MATVSVGPLTRQNLSTCAELWSDRRAYTPDEFDLVMRVASHMLDERRALGAVMMHGNRAVSFGMTAFVDEPFIRSYLATPFQHLGKHLLLSSATGTGPILGVRAIGEGNAGESLNLVVVNASHDTTLGNTFSAITFNIEAFQDVHRGYRIGRIVNEAYGEEPIRLVETNFEKLGYFMNSAGLRSFVGVLTRDLAHSRMSPLMPMFSYSPPRIRFTLAEQTLLRAALDGGTNESIAQKLEIAATAVSARWNRILTRALRYAPDIFAGLTDGLREDVRGRQARHLIVEYVRKNPSELTPYFENSRRRTDAGRR